MNRATSANAGMNLRKWTKGSNTALAKREVPSKKPTGAPTKDPRSHPDRIRKRLIPVSCSSCPFAMSWWKPTPISSGEGRKNGEITKLDAVCQMARTSIRLTKDAMENRCRRHKRPRRLSVPPTGGPPSALLDSGRATVTLIAAHPPQRLADRQWPETTQLQSSQSYS